jgi:peptide/nickel transport system permease protein
MIAYVLSRLWQAIIVMLTVVALAFVMFTYLGDPVVAILGADSSQAAREAVRRDLGLDQPMIVQFGDYLMRLLSGDFGISYRLGLPVEQVLVERLPATVELATFGMALALGFGIPLGILTAIRRRSAGSQALLGISLVGISMPSFLAGVLLIWLFSVTLQIFPSFGRGDTVHIGWWSTGLLTASGWRSLVLPALTIAIFQVAMMMRLVRAEMLEVLRKDFIRFARARGLPNRSVHLRHALRNTLVPVVTIAGLQFGSVIAFAVITESVFQWPGLGLLFLQSIAAADVPVISTYLVLMAGVFVAMNLAVDLLYLWIDPRLRSSGGAEAIRR